MTTTSTPDPCTERTTAARRQNYERFFVPLIPRPFATDL